MSANTHTPGPWEVLDGNRVSVTLPCADVEASGYVSACIAITHSSEPRVDKVANARLIAAAPELLEALKAIEARITYYAGLAEGNAPNIEQWAYTDQSGDLANARAAIAKIEGEMK